MKYLHLFKTQSAHTEAYKRGGGYVEPWVDFVKETDEVHYNLPSIDWSTQYLTFKALQDSTFKLDSNSVSYSTDFGETWTTLASNTNSPTVKKDEYIMWKGQLTPTSSFGVGRFSSTGNYEVMGNPYSLLYGDNFEGVIDLTGKNYALNGLFSGSTGLTSAENLSLPATTLSVQCYRIMFNSCTSLTTAPTLPATTLAANCYQGMFNGCTSLTAAPELPATRLANNCYIIMFGNCTSLTTAPELPATTLADGCYQSMFKGCTLLTAAPELPVTTLAKECYKGMFSNCTSLTTAPELLAATLTSACYYSMFSNCKSLSYIKMLATNVSAYDCLTNWVSGVASSGTFVKNTSMSSLPSGPSGVPEGWTVQTASA